MQYEKVHIICHMRCDEHSQKKRERNRDISKKKFKQKCFKRNLISMEMWHVHCMYAHKTVNAMLSFPFSFLFSLSLSLSPSFLVEPILLYIFQRNRDSSGDLQRTDKPTYHEQGIFAIQLEQKKKSLILLCRFYHIYFYYYYYYRDFCVRFLVRFVVFIFASAASHSLYIALRLNHKT